MRHSPHSIEYRVFGRGSQSDPTTSSWILFHALVGLLIVLSGPNPFLQAQNLNDSLPPLVEPLAIPRATLESLLPNTKPFSSLPVPPKVARMTELEARESEKRSDKKATLIKPIARELKRQVTYQLPLESSYLPGNGNLSYGSKRPADVLQSIPFTDLPTLEPPSLETSSNTRQDQDDVAPMQDLDRQNLLPENEQELIIRPQPENHGQIPVSPPMMESFEIVKKSDVYEDGKPDSKTTFPLWWDDLVVNPQSGMRNHWNVGINDLIVYFLKNSPRLRAIQLVRESTQPSIPESAAEFDPTVFVESNFVRLNDPIGNTLTTGGTGRFLDNNWTSRGGLRKKFRTGGSLEAFQRFGIQTNNSEFFVPDQQGTAYLSLNFTQPLLNGRGKLYNESLIAIANLENNLAGSVAEEKIQTELLELAEFYWELYSFRAIWFQKRKNVERAESVYNELLGRKDFDVSRTQLLRAKAAVETRKAEVIQALNNVRDTEARISSILGIDVKQRFEYVPNFVPNLYFPSVEMGDAFVTALSNRPEILQAGRQVEIAATRANRSRHELLPVLDLLIGTYVSGLDSNYEFIDAFGRQFSDGAPGYSAALNFEMPIYRRAAKARLDRNELRWQAITSELESKILEVKSEVDIAVREVETSHRKLIARNVAMDSARQEMLAQRERLILSLNDGDHIGNTLNFLLDAQDRLAAQENLLAQAQADYMVSWVALKKAMGTLVLVENGK